MSNPPPTYQAYQAPTGAAYQGYQGPPPPPAYAPPPGYAPSYQSGAPPTTAQPGTQTTYITYTARGNCPACHIGFLQEGFTPLGICLAIFFFPIGLLCCIMLSEKRCNNCGMSFA